MGNRDKKSKLSKERARYQQLLDRLTQESNQLDDQITKIKKRNVNLVTQMSQQKDELKTLENMVKKEYDMIDGGDRQELAVRSKADDKNAMHDELIQNEIDALCTKTLEHYIEPLTKQNLNFQVEHQGNRAVFELKSENHTFGDIKPGIAQYFALPVEVIFFKNEKDEVLLSNLKVLPTLFPMLNSKIRGYTPVLKLALKGNMSTLDYILGNEQVKQAADKEREEQEQNHQKNIKQSRLRDEAKQKEEEFNKQRDGILKKQRCIRIIIGVTQTAIFLLFIIFQVLQTVAQRNVILSYTHYQSIKNQLFLSEKPHIEFSSQAQMKNYLKYAIDDQLTRDWDDLDMFWQSNNLLEYVQVMQIRGVERPCDYTGRASFTEYFGKDVCVSQYFQKDFNTSTFKGDPYVEKQSFIKNRASRYDYAEAGVFKYLKVNLTNIDWIALFEKHIDQTGWIDENSLVVVFTFNIYNPTLNSVQSFKLISSLQSGGIVVMEYDDININLQMFQYREQQVQSILIFIIGAILLIISILDMRNQKKQAAQQVLLDLEDQKRLEGKDEGKKEEKPDDENQKSQREPTGEASQGDIVAEFEKRPKKEPNLKKKKLLKRIFFCSLKGVSTFEIINFLMIICTFINQGLKYLYDKVTYDQVFKDNQLHNSYVDFSQVYIFYEAVCIFDSFIVFMMAISIIKYTFIWVPSLSIITLSLQTYLNATIKKIFTFVLLVSFAFAAFCHYFFSYTAFGFYDFAFALIRANLLFVKGNLFNNNSIYLANESQEYVFERLGWAAALLVMGTMHLFGKFVIQNIIVAFMKKDLTDTRKAVARQQALERKKASEMAKKNLTQKKKK